MWSWRQNAHGPSFRLLRENCDSDRLKATLFSLFGDEVLTRNGPGSPQLVFQLRVLQSEVRENQEESQWSLLKLERISLDVYVYLCVVWHCPSHRVPAGLCGAWFCGSSQAFLGKYFLAEGIFVTWSRNSTWLLNQTAGMLISSFPKPWWKFT